METKHTKGEWVSEESQTSFDFLIWDTQMESDTPKLIARVKCEDVTDEECEANAKLIAAAPEMLEVLNDCAETMNILLIELKKDDVILRHEVNSRLSQINKAIEKATK